MTRLGLCLREDAHTAKTPGKATGEEPRKDLASGEKYSDSEPSRMKGRKRKPRLFPWDTGGAVDSTEDSGPIKVED